MKKYFTLLITLFLLFSAVTDADAYRRVFKGIARAKSGAALSQATASVYVAGGTTAASVYTTLTSNTAVNSVTCGDDGSFTFYVSSFDYDTDQTFKIIITKTGYASKTYDDVYIKDAVLGTYTISADTTVTTALKIPKGVIYSINSGKTLTINGTFKAGLYQVFSGAGTVAFGSGAAIKVLPQWWGAKGDGTTDDTTALNAAIATGKPVYLPFATYATTGLTVNVPQFSLEGEIGSGNAGTTGTGSRIYMSATSGDVFSFGTSSDRFHIRNITIVGADVANTRVGINTNNVLIVDSLIENCYIHYMKYGIRIKNGYNTTIRKCRLNGSTPLIAGSIGIQIGEDAVYAPSAETISEVYITTYATGIYNKYADNTVMIHPIVESCTTAIDNSGNGSGIIIEPAFSGNTTDINNYSSAGNTGWLQVYSSRGLNVAPNINGNYMAYREVGRGSLAMRVFLGTSDQSVAKETATTVVFNTNLYNDPAGYFNVSTGVFTAPKSGFYLLVAQVTYETLADGKYAYVAIRVNGSGVTTTYLESPGAGIPLSITSTTIAWVEAGQTVDVRTYHNDTVDRNIDNGAGITYLAISAL